MAFDVGAPVDREAVDAIGRNCIDCSASFVVLKSDGLSTRLLSWSTVGIPKTNTLDV